MTLVIRTTLSVCFLLSVKLVFRSTSPAEFECLIQMSIKEDEATRTKQFAERNREKTPEATSSNPRLSNYSCRHYVNRPQPLEL